MKNQEIIADFGKEFIQEVRDDILEKFEKITNGDYKNDEKLYLTYIIKKIGNNQKALELMIGMLDVSIHRFFFFFEESEKWTIALKEECEEKGIKTLIDMSDGLYGESYGEDGWIAKYSKYKELKNYMEKED